MMKKNRRGVIGMVLFTTFTMLSLFMSYEKIKARPARLCALPFMDNDSHIVVAGLTHFIPMKKQSTVKETYENGKAYFEYLGNRRNYEQEIRDCKDSLQMRLILRDYYKEVEPFILANNGKFDVYDLGDSIIQRMTPIERLVFSLTRTIGRCYFYPEYPIGKYFADFANPFHKIIIECDGKEWHDEERDKIRDSFIYEYGYKVYRLPGKSCFTLVSDLIPDMEDRIDEMVLQSGYLRSESENYLLNEIKDQSAEALLKIIQRTYFDPNHFAEYNKQELENEFRTRIGLDEIDFNSDEE